jgi:predicted DsbA family dithiol-disulfide isomerase
LNAGMPAETVTVYFDYLCPYAWHAAELAETVSAPLDVRFAWSHVSLYQLNHRGADGWQLWNESIDPRDESGTRGLLPFLASLAARRQGEALHDAFRLALLRFRHRDLRPLHRATVMEAAEEAQLHLACFERDLRDPESRTELAREHHQALATRVFGTPTFVLPSGDVAYVRLRGVPSEREAAVELYRRVTGMLHDYPYLETVKRPRLRGN